MSIYLFIFILFVFAEILNNCFQYCVTGGAVTQIVRSYNNVPKDFKLAHFDELPVPSGPWQHDHDRRQRKYNLQLLFGASFFIFTIFAVSKQSAIASIYIRTDNAKTTKNFNEHRNKKK